MPIWLVFELNMIARKSNIHSLGKVVVIDGLSQLILSRQDQQYLGVIRLQILWNYLYLIVFLMVQLCMFYLVFNVDTLNLFCWDTFLFLLIYWVGASLGQEDFLGFYHRVSMSLLECLCIWYCWTSFFVNLLMCWCTSFCCSIVIRFRKYLANFMFKRSSYSSAYWRRWYSLWFAEFRFTCFNWFCAIFRMLVIVLIQSPSIFTGCFIVLMIWFIFSSFGILPHLCDFIDFHRDTSRMALPRLGDHGSRCSILLRKASASSTPVVISLSSESIFVMSLLVSLFVFMSPFILSIFLMMSFFFTYAWRVFLYFVTRLMSFDCNNLLDRSILFCKFL